MKTFYIQRKKPYSWKSRRIGEISIRYINNINIKHVLSHVSKRLPDCRLKKVYTGYIPSKKGVVYDSFELLG